MAANIQPLVTQHGKRAGLLQQTHLLIVAGREQNPGKGEALGRNLGWGEGGQAEREGLRQRVLESERHTDTEKEENQKHKQERE